MNLLSRFNVAILKLCLSVFSNLAIAEKSIQDIRFKKGATSGEYARKVNGYDYNEYIFYAKKGQSLTATLDTTSTKLWMRLFNQHLPDSINIDEYSSSLNDQGAYTLPYIPK
ncbi:hypothetical protein [Vibrio caribbeanicus]|uniref:hypothetical protein n=1 Tax=Vibrio caribbeanicus TaxID=701175 RepID=UPI002284041F|nr:hypothetical protein [Vibrio caribbeanicus]MCY9846054.1 hypothetical protein [Vibrio caribbeanicus]